MSLNCLCHCLRNTCGWRYLCHHQKSICATICATRFSKNGARTFPFKCKCSSNANLRAAFVFYAFRHQFDSKLEPKVIEECGFSIEFRIKMHCCLHHFWHGGNIFATLFEKNIKSTRPPPDRGGPIKGCRVCLTEFSSRP